MTWDESEHPRGEDGRFVDKPPFAIRLNGRDVTSKYVWTLKYSPDQPRVPSGHSEGGRWTSMPFGEWAVNLQNGKLRGWRGTNPTGVGFGSSEGQGTYVAKDEKLARFFAGADGKVSRYEFEEPRNPFVVEGEEMYLLTESDKLEEPPSKSDSPWLAANKRAVARMYRETGGEWDPDLAGKYLSDDLKKAGHDAVMVSSGGEEWVVLF